MNEKKPLQSRTIHSTDNLALNDKSIPYEILVEENEAGIFCLENDIISYTNKAFAEVLGVPASTILGSSILDKTSEEDRSFLQEGLDKIIQGEKERFSHDLRLKQNGNEPVYFSLHLKAYAREEGKVSIIGASRNATTRVNKSLELVKTRSRYEALYRNIVDGIVIYNYAEERMVDHNDAALKILGYSKSEDILKIHRHQLIPKTSSYFPGMDLHEHTKDHGRRVMKGESFHTPGIFNANGGKQIIVEVNVVPTFHQYGEAFVIFHDITQKVLDQKAKKETEKKYREIFENSHEAIIYRDANSLEAIICNDNALDLLGVNSFEELAALKPVDIYAQDSIEGLSPEAYSNKKNQEALDKGRAEVAFELKKQNGKTIQVSGVVIGDKSDPEHPKIISFLLDISHLHATRKALHEKNIELDKYIESNSQLENFAYFASHDLQAPLRSMISFTQLLKLKLKGRLSEEEQECMNFIISGGKNMRNLINDLLTYSRIKNSNINISQIELDDVFRQLSTDLKTIIQEKSAQIDYRNIPRQIQGDVTKIQQIFQNLINNAIKFSKPDTPPKVVVDCVEKEEHWKFSIQDNGIGIDPKYHKEIFLLFRRLHGHGEYEGTGIGLAMVKKIVEQHEGEINFSSALGEGTCFNFTIKKQFPESMMIQVIKE